MPEIRCAALALFAAAVLPCGAQTWRISPGVSITETYSDNLGLEAQPLASRGWLTDLSPTLHVENPLNARVHVMADYRLHALYYSDDSRRNETQNFLDALARIEAVEKSLFLDARAAINLQSRTPFGTTLAPDFPGATQNRVETRVLGLQPRWLGNLGDFAVFRAQYAIYGMRVDDPLVPDLTSQHFAAQVRSPSGGSRLGWALDTDYMEIRPDQAQPRDLSLARLSLRATVWSTVQVALSEGYDNTNISTEGRRRGTVPGLGLTWMPSPRTQFATLNERRFFGSSYATSLTHRTASTAWRLNATREVTSLAEIISAGSGMSLSSLLDSLLATAVPDPQQRSNVVAERFRRQGLSDSSPLTANFVTTRPVLRRRIEGSVAYVAPRNVLNLSAMRTDERALDASGALDGFALVDDIRRTGASAGFSHALTPLTTAHLTASHLRTVALDNSGFESVQKLLNIYLTTQLGPHTFVSFGARHGSFNSNLQPGYRENAVYATFSVRL